MKNRLIIISAACFMAVLVAVTNQKAEPISASEKANTGSKYMTVKEFICETVKELERKPVNKSQTTVKRLVEKYHISATEAGYVRRALLLGIIDNSVLKKLDGNISLQQAAVIALRALLYLQSNSTDGRYYIFGGQANSDAYPLHTASDIAEKDSVYVLENRITDADRIKKEWKEEFACAYILGLISGTSDGRYSATRTFRPRSLLKREDCMDLISRIDCPDKRYKLTEDYQMIRTGDSDMPKLEKFYLYILDSFPNEYYDCVFNFMTNQVMVFEAAESDWWLLRNCDTYKQRMTWDSAFSHLTLDDRLGLIGRNDLDRLETYSAFLYPAEYSSAAKELISMSDDGDCILAVDYFQKSELAKAAEEYVYKALNVDYKSIGEDEDWREYMLNNGHQMIYVDEYISDAKLDELIIECSEVSCDPSTMYYDVTPFTFGHCNGVVRVRAKYRVISDNGKAFMSGGLVINSGMSVNCLRETRISDDGFYYEWVPSSEWKEGFFDIGVRLDGSIRSASFNVIYNNGSYVSLLGFPAERPMSYPGSLTTRGIWNRSFSGRKWEDYLEQWGYQY